MHIASLKPPKDDRNTENGMEATRQNCRQYQNYANINPNTDSMTAVSEAT